MTIHRIAAVVTLICLFLATTALRADQTAKPDCRDVTVTVRIRDNSGNPIPGLALMFWPPSEASKPFKEREYPRAVTDDGGVAVATMCLTPLDTEVALTLSHSLGKVASREQNKVYAERFKQVASAFAIETVYPVQTPPPSSAVAVDVVLKPGVTVTGRVVHASSRASNVHLWIPGAMPVSGVGMAFTSDDGTFRFTQAPSGRPFHVRIKDGDSLRVIRVPSTPPGGEVDLGTIDFGPAPSPESMVPIDVRFEKIPEGPRDLAASAVGLGQYHTAAFIKADGSDIRAFAINRQNDSLAYTADHSPIQKVPAGRYYVVVGPGENAEMIAKVRALAALNRPELLESLPVMEFAGDQTQERRVDAEASLSASKRVVEQFGALVP